MGPTWGPSGADRTQVGPMLAPWTLLSGTLSHKTIKNLLTRQVLFFMVSWFVVAIDGWLSFSDRGNDFPSKLQVTKTFHASDGQITLAIKEENLVLQQCQFVPKSRLIIVMRYHPKSFSQWQTNFQQQKKNHRHKNSCPGYVLSLSPLVIGRRYLEIRASQNGWRVFR